MTGTLQDEDKTHWKDFVPTLVHAYNCTRSNATEFSPYFLMFRWKPRLGLNLQFGLQTEEQLHQVHHDYVSQLEDKLYWTYNLSQEMQEHEVKHHKQWNDCKMRCTQLELGDHILLWQKGFQTKHKIVDHWENTTYEIVEKLKDVPIYTIREFPKPSMEENESCLLHTLVVHRNMLFLLACRETDVPEDRDNDSGLPDY